MKVSIFKIENLVMGFGLLLISLAGNSQDIKLSKEEKKAAKRDKDYYNYQVVDSMVENRSFVLEADYLEDRYGIRQPVSSLLNFIRVESSDAVLQTGSNWYEGSNAVGGVTAEGSIQGLKITKNTKNLSFFLRFTVMTNIGIYDVAMTINSDKNARAEISGLGPGKLIYNGHILNPWESKAYKGRNTI
jgi:hypothetical protein